MYNTINISQDSWEYLIIDADIVPNIIYFDLLDGWF